MTSLREFLKSFTAPAVPLAAGMYSTPVSSPEQGRLHLRIEKDGTGILVVNAATILHLNQTACEYAYHLVHGRTIGEVGSQVSRRYHITASQARLDYEEFVQQINTLRTTTDLDPEMFLNMERVTPRSQVLSAPLRLDCALTYRLPEGVSAAAAPARRVERELSTAEWQGILDTAWQAGIPHVIFTGGEPTLRTDLVELVTHAEKLGMVSGLLTDGLRFNQPAYLDSLLNSGLDHILFLLDVNNDASWSALRRALISDVFVGVHITIQDAPIHYDSLVEKLAGLGVKAVSLTSAHESLKDILEDAARMVNETGMELIWDIPVPYSAANPVSFGLEGQGKSGVDNPATAYVEPDGDVLAEQGIPKVYGNLRKDSWKDIWQHLSQTLAS